LAPPPPHCARVVIARIGRSDEVGHLFGYAGIN